MLIQGNGSSAKGTKNHLLSSLKVCCAMLCCTVLCFRAATYRYGALYHLRCVCREHDICPVGKQLKKIFLPVVDELNTSDGCVARWKDLEWTTSAGYPPGAVACFMYLHTALSSHTQLHALGQFRGIFEWKLCSLCLKFLLCYRTVLASNFLSCDQISKKQTTIFFYRAVTIETSAYIMLRNGIQSSLVNNQSSQQHTTSDSKFAPAMFASSCHRTEMFLGSLFPPLVICLCSMLC